VKARAPGLVPYTDRSCVWIYDMNTFYYTLVTEPLGCWDLRDTA